MKSIMIVLLIILRESISYKFVYLYAIGFVNIKSFDLISYRSCLYKKPVLVPYYRSYWSMQICKKCIKHTYGEW